MVATGKEEQGGAQSLANQSIGPKLSQLGAIRELSLNEQLSWFSQLSLTEHFSQLSALKPM